jgi:transposase
MGALLELKELEGAREALAKDRTAARNRGNVLTLSLLKRQNGQRLEQVDRQMATIEAAILEIIEADESLADRFAILTSIPGVSTITAFARLIAMPELAALEAGQAATSQAWRQSPDSQGAEPVAHSFEAGAPTFARRSTWPPSSPLASTRT